MGLEDSRMNLQAALPRILPLAIAWAEARAAEVARSGIALNDSLLAVACSVGVCRPELIRVALVDSLPVPEAALLRAAATQTGLLGPDMEGLTLGYSVFVRSGHDTLRILSHEFRHVFQYEQAGSIAAFLPIYLAQVVRFGYADAPLEQDARAHERSDSSCAHQLRFRFR
jgi:hypothetical protein